MAAVTLLFGGVGTLSWTAQENVIVTGLQCVSTAASRLVVVSDDPALTAAAFGAPSANGVDRNLIAACTNSFSASLSVPLSAGETLFVANTGSGSVIIFYEPVTETI